MNESDLKRFFQKVVRGPKCWTWISSTSRGYGMFWLSGRSVLAHRVSWEIHNGPIPDGMDVLHKCDRPYCVNPDHLFLGTHLDNMADMRRKNRTGPRAKHINVGETHPRAKLTEDDVRRIRDLYKIGLSQHKIAEKFGVNQGTVSQILSGKIWTHVVS